MEPGDLGNRGLGLARFALACAVVAIFGCRSGGHQAEPSLSKLSAPERISPGQSGIIHADYSTGSPVAFVELSLHNELGDSSGSIPAEILQLHGSSGRLSLPFDSSDLAFGPNDFSLAIQDTSGRVSKALEFRVALAGASSGGAAPSVTAFAPRHSAWRRPAGTRARLDPKFHLEWTASAGDVARVRIRVEPPAPAAPSLRELPASSLGIRGASGVSDAALLTLRATDALGAYVVKLVLFDANGNASGEAQASLQLVDSGGQAAVSIAGFSPASGRAGEMVTLTGEGFGDSTRVTLAGVQAEVASVTSSQSVQVVVPEGAGTGRFAAWDAEGFAASDNLFVVPPSVTVTPASARVPVLGSAQFQASVVSTASAAVVWSVNGIEGGNATVGAVRADGFYTAPAELPPGAEVTLRASLASDRAIGGEARVALMPPLSQPGRGRVLASVGGRVESDDARAAVDIPPGALPSSADVTVNILRGRGAPPAAAGRRLLGAIELGPSGTQFSRTVTVTIPLARSYPPGTRLRAPFFDASGGGWRDEGIIATVADTADRATAQIRHFSTLGIDDPAPRFGDDQFSRCSLPSLSIDTIEPSFGQEGSRLPVRVRGSGITPDLTVRILRDGNDTDDIRPGTLFALQDTAGFMLDIQPILDLPAGVGRAYTVRLERPGGCVHADATFTVQGLDELVVPAGTTRMLDTSGSIRAVRYSMVNIAGTALVPPRARLIVESTGPVRIDGQVLANGDDGADANGPEGGAGGLTGGRGGRGEGSDDEKTGGDADATFRGHIAQGIGGRHGVDVNLTDVINLVEDAFDCGGGDISACVQFFEDLAVIIDTATAFAERGGAGEGGYGGIRGGGEHGGGGGGGGGETRVRIIITLGEVTGGGGGAGGEGGRSVSFRSGDAITLGPGALINTRGGKGGDGSTEGHLEILGFDIADVHTGSGGGGGGGGDGGGTALMAARVLAVHSPNTQVLSGGGLGGIGGIQVIDRHTSTGVVLTHYVFKTGRGEPGRSAGRTLSSGDAVFTGVDPVPDYHLLDSMVTDRTAFIVRFSGGLQDRATFTVTDESGTPHDFVAVRDSDGYLSARVLLSQGFNTIGGDDIVFGKRILVIAKDSDGDGLSDADEIALGSDPNNPDTDGSGLTDGVKFILGLNLNDPDADEDGLLDGRELELRTDPHNRDTDGDGVNDGVEVVLGTDPLDRNSFPTAVPSGSYYTARYSRNGMFLAIFDPVSGTTGLVDRPNQGLGFGLAFGDNGTLYVGKGRRLATIEPIRGATTDVGDYLRAGVPVEIGALAFNPVDHKLYGLEVNRANPPDVRTRQLVLIDPATAAVTRIGSEGPREILALAFNQAGALFATVEGDSNSSVLASVDRVTGAVTDIGRIGFPSVYGLALDPGGALRGITSNGRLLTIDVRTGTGSQALRLGRLVRGLTIKGSGGGAPGGVLHVEWTLDGAPGVPGCGIHSATQVHFVLNPLEGQPFVDLGTRPCADGVASFPTSGMVPGLYSFHGELRSAGGNLLSEVTFSFYLAVVIPRQYLVVDFPFGGPTTSCRATGTTHGSSITASETWTAAASPHHVAGVTVSNGAVLTVEPGATVCVGDAGQLWFLGGARLVAGAAGGNPVTFTGEYHGAGSPPAVWKWIALNGSFPIPPGFHSAITNAIIEYAGDGGVLTDFAHPVLIDRAIFRSISGMSAFLRGPGSQMTSSTVDAAGMGMGGVNPAVRLEGGSESITFQSRVKNAPGPAAIAITGPNVALSRCEIVDSAHDGASVAATPASNVSIAGCNLLRNGGLAINNASSTAVTADNDWWDPPGDGSPPRIGSPNGVSANVTVTNVRSSRVILDY